MILGGNRVDQALDQDRSVVSGLVFGELAYKSVLAWRRESGDRDPITTFRSSAADVMRRMGRKLDRLWTALDQLELEGAITDGGVIRLAKQLMTKPGLPPRHAFHAAHALEARCRFVVSSDRDYDRVPSLKRLGPPEV